MNSVYRASYLAFPRWCINLNSIRRSNPNQFGCTLHPSRRYPKNHADMKTSRIVVQLLPQSPLSQVPDASSQPLGGGAHRGTGPVELLPRRVNPCRTNSPNSCCRTSTRSTTCCSTAWPIRCWRSQPTPSAWVPRSAFWACCTLGTDARASPAHPLCRAGRGIRPLGIRPRPHPLDSA
jgi:hypothetical protein